MIRFLLIHYLAIYTALVPVICCCSASPSPNAARSADSSSESEHACCCQKRTSHSQSQPITSPINDGRKECPCVSCKVFLPSVSSANLSYALRTCENWFENGTLDTLPFTLEYQSSLYLHKTSFALLNSSSRSSVEILRAKCVLRC